MTAPSRYHVGSGEAGIGAGGVLINKLGFTDQVELDDAETVLLLDTQTHYFELLSEGEIHFDLRLIFEIHKYFLGTLYDWAGEPRKVNISKDGTFFAPVEHLANSLAELSEVFNENVPDNGERKETIAYKLAVIHDEFIAVHPFREGNGRVIRLYIDMLVEHLDLRPIDWESGDYLAACRRGMSKDYEPMIKIILSSI